MSIDLYEYYFTLNSFVLKVKGCLSVSESYPDKYERLFSNLVEVNLARKKREKEN